MEQKNHLLTKEDEKIDVTKEIRERCYSKIKHYEEAIKRVTKDGTIYIIEFADGYTAFTQKIRKARRIGELQWYLKIANEEKENGYDLKHYIEEFKKNKIAFDGKNIPEFIDTIEDVKARKQKEQKNVKLQVAN